MKTYSYAHGIALLSVLLSACSNGSAPSVPPSSAAPDGNALPAVTTAQAVSTTRFDQKISDLPAGGNCALDAIQGAAATGAAVAVGEDVLFGGWMGDGNGHVPSDAVIVFSSASGSYSAPVTGGGSRPDVAQALSQEKLATAGYDVRIKMDVSPGTYELFIVQGGGSPVACPLGSLSVQ